MEMTLKGTAKRDYEPEIGELNLTLSAEEPDQRESITQVGRLSSALTNCLDSMESRHQIEHWSMSTPMTWSWQVDERPKRRMYRTSMQVAIEFCDFSALSSFVLDGGGEPGCNLLEINWRLRSATEDTEKLSLLRQAVSNAMTKARQIADVTGVGELECLEVTDPHMMNVTGSDDGWHPGVTPRTMMGADVHPPSAVIEVKPERVSLSATIWARFAGHRL